MEAFLSKQNELNQLKKYISDIKSKLLKCFFLNTTE